MSKYVAFLRAINVGGHNVIKMADLKQMFTSFGMENVQTYIQSGNVIFESSEEEPRLLEQRIESELEKALRHKVQVFVRTMHEVRNMVRKPPFTPRAEEALHVMLLKDKPGKKQQQELLSLQGEADDFAIRGREVYNLRRNREKSIFSNNLIEKLLAMPGTTRNITVLSKIAEKYG